MSEKSFQQYIIKILKSHNYFVRTMSFAINCCAGFPDLFILKNGKFALIEIKEIKIKKGYSFKNLFEKTQPPFYLEYLKHSSRLFLLIRVHENGIRYFCILKTTAFFVKKLNEIKWSNLKNYTNSFLKTKYFSDILRWFETYMEDKLI